MDKDARIAELEKALGLAVVESGRQADDIRRIAELEADNEDLRAENARLTATLKHEYMVLCDGCGVDAYPETLTRPKGDGLAVCGACLQADQQDMLAEARREGHDDALA